MPLAEVLLGAPIETVGGFVSTVKVAEGPAAGAKLFAKSLAVPEPMLMRMVPLPDKLPIETVLRLPLEPDIVGTPLALPVVMTVTFELRRSIASAPVYVMV